MRLNFIAAEDILPQVLEKAIQLQHQYQAISAASLIEQAQEALITAEGQPIRYPRTRQPDAKEEELLTPEKLAHCLATLYAYPDISKQANAYAQTLYGYCMLHPRQAQRRQRYPFPATDISESLDSLEDQIRKEVAMTPVYGDMKLPRYITLIFAIEQAVYAAVEGEMQCKDPIEG